MSRQDLNRRDFNKLSMAALGGLIAGTSFGCQSEENTESTTSTESEENSEENKEKNQNPQSEDPQEAETPRVTKAEPHACFALNECKNQGRTGMNECAGQGVCATVEHNCQGNNSCKYLGGGETAGMNECKGQGKCHVPLDPTSETWKQARNAFEERMKAKNKPFAAAPQI